ncbi:hypothetical protein BD560DRAFT_433329 [Blakeslea trispora]|nr:hypothetical protein BD560DRAFT_433329 [Blakeslea trispora]
MSYRRALEDTFYLGGPPGMRRASEMSVEEFHDLFYIVAQAKLRDNIIREKNKKKPNYSAFKAKTLAGPIPRGLYADIDKYANLGLRESANRFQNDNSVSRAIDLWRRYVQQNLDVVQESVSNPTTEAISFTQAIEPSSEKLPTEPAPFVVEEYFEIRDDLAPEVRQLFDTKLAELLPQTSNFISDFQTIMFMKMSCFRSQTFAVRNGKSSGFDGVRGLQTKTKTDYPFRTLLMEAISDSVNQFIQPKNTLHMACYESALTNYITDLSVMWALETKKPKTASAKRKQPSEPDVAEGFERPR